MSDQAADRLRVRRVWLSQIREELLAPVHAITGYADVVHEEASRISLDDRLPDIERIRLAARNLESQVNRLVASNDAVGPAAGALPTNEEQILHHELRTPLNAIIGYGEMLIEDLSSAEMSSLRSDIKKLVAGARDLLSRLSFVIGFARSDARNTNAAIAAPAVVQDLLRSFRPAKANTDGPARTGYILVVDDIEANRDLLSRRLSREGCRVASAAGGRQALQMVEQEDFDLILLDLMMPDLNGFDVLRQLKADERLRRVPVIMISAIEEAGSVIGCIEAGAEDYLPKPFDPVLLRARINASLDKKRWRDREREYLRELEEERRKFERLLLSVLPKPIISRLNQGELLIADRFDNATVLISDLVGFTAHSATSTPTEIVKYLNRLFSEFDSLAATLGVEKIKTIGDAYMVVAGVPEPKPDHCEAVVRMAIAMIDVLERVNEELGWSFKIRIGIHSGPVVAGIVGTHRIVYDIWGDTVNMASRLETSSFPNRIHVSTAVAEKIVHCFEVEPRGDVDLKGKGSLKTHFIALPYRNSERAKRHCLSSRD